MMNAAQALLRELRNDPYAWGHLTHDLREAIREELERADTTTTLIPIQPRPRHPRAGETHTEPHELARIRASMNRQAERKRLRNLLPDALTDGP